MLYKVILKLIFILCEGFAISIIHKLPHDVRRVTYALLRMRSFFRMIKYRRSYVGSYSYQPFDETQTIFIHIPKTAGISVCKSLYGNLAGGHQKISYYQYVFSKKDFTNYFKYTFVRNPWDRLYSTYSFLKEGGLTKEDKDWASTNLSQFFDFKDFVMNWVTKANINKYIHFVPQVDYLCYLGESKITIDFLGFFENLEEDFNYISARMGKNISLPHLNKGNSKEMSYISQYTSEMIAIVENVYDVDIKTFGYSFDNSAINKQLEKRSQKTVKKNMI